METRKRVTSRLTRAIVCTTLCWAIARFFFRSAQSGNPWDGSYWTKRHSRDRRNLDRDWHMRRRSGHGLHSLSHFGFPMDRSTGQPFGSEVEDQIVEAFRGFKEENRRPDRRELRSISARARSEGHPSGAVHYVPEGHRRIWHQAEVTRNGRPTQFAARLLPPLTAEQTTDATTKGSKP